MSKARKPLKPGMKAPTSGQYRNTKTGYEVTVTKGERLPPSPVKGATYKLVDPTKHKSKK
jgi:hypothetical protein